MKDYEYQDFIRWCEVQHNEICNQKYEGLPFSVHLNWVMAQARLFKKLVPKNDWWLVLAACAGHDLIEDARVTYNDIVDKGGTELADIIYACTEEKGRNRDERHSMKYYVELAKDPLAIFVKLCDIIANVKFSLLTNSSMLSKYRKEHEKTVRYLYLPLTPFGEMFRYLDALLKVEPNQS